MCAIGEDSGSIFVGFYIFCDMWGIGALDDGLDCAGDNGLPAHDIVAIVGNKDGWVGYAENENGEIG